MPSSLFPIDEGQRKSIGIAFPNIRQDDRGYALSISSGVCIFPQRTIENRTPNYQLRNI